MQLISKKECNLIWKMKILIKWQEYIETMSLLEFSLKLASSNVNFYSQTPTAVI